MKSDVREKRGFPSQRHRVRLCLTRRAGLIPPPPEKKKNPPLPTCMLGILTQRIYLLHFRSLFTDLCCFKNSMYIRDAIHFLLARNSSLRKEGKIRCLGFSSRSDSFAFCALHKPAQYPRSPDFVRPKIRSWIIGVHKV